MGNPIVRLTWQVSERNKFAVYMDRALRLRGHAMGALTDPQHRVGDLEHAEHSATGSAKWTSTLSSKPHAGLTTRYAANCLGACTPGALVLPAMAASGLATINVPLVAPETEFTPRINQFDFSVSKSFEFGTFRVSPKLDLFNALNSDDYTVGRDDAVRRRDLSASLGDSAGPDHPHRRGCALVKSQGA